MSAPPLSLHETIGPVPWVAVAQVAAAAVLVAVALVAARFAGVRMERETAVAFVRGLAQILAMGLVVGALLGLPLWWAFLVLVGMAAGAASLTRRHARRIPGVFGHAFLAVSLAATVTLGTMTATGAIEADARSLVPVGSMMVANTMQATSLALERVHRELSQHRDRVEGLLCLGATGPAAAGDLSALGARASLIPSIAALRSLGWIWIPGVMTGMILAGTPPVEAALFQFLIVAMILAASALASVLVTRMALGGAFTEAHQLRDLD